MAHLLDVMVEHNAKRQTVAHHPSADSSLMRTTSDPHAKWRHAALTQDTWIPCEVFLQGLDVADEAAVEAFLTELQAVLAEPPTPHRMTLSELLSTTDRAHERQRQATSLLRIVRTVQDLNGGGGVWDDMHPLRLAILMQQLSPETLTANDMSAISPYVLATAISEMEDLSVHVLDSIDRLRALQPLAHEHADAMFEDLPYRLSALEIEPPRPPTKTAAVPPPPPPTTPEHDEKNMAGCETKTSSGEWDEMNDECMLSAPVASPTAMCQESILGVVLANVHMALRSPEGLTAACCTAIRRQLRMVQHLKEPLPEWYLLAILSLTPQPKTPAETQRWAQLLRSLLAGHAAVDLPHLPYRGLPTGFFNKARAAAMAPAASPGKVSPHERMLPVILRLRPARLLNTRTQIQHLWQHVYKRLCELGRAGEAAWHDYWLEDIAVALTRYGPPCPPALRKQFVNALEIPTRVRTMITSGWVSHQ